MSSIKITKIKSTIGHPKKIVKIMDGLGLRKIGHTRSYKDTNCIRGMVNKVKHLVSYELEK